jgi:hypothetical protein
MSLLMSICTIRLIIIINVNRNHETRTKHNVTGVMLPILKVVVMSFTILIIFFSFLKYFLNRAPLYITEVNK